VPGFVWDDLSGVLVYDFYRDLRYGSEYSCSPVRKEGCGWCRGVGVIERFLGCMCDSS